MRALVTGLVAGTLLGIVARVWMRLITDDPEFSWAGTGYIVGAFATMGLAHAAAAEARRRALGPGWRGAARVAGAVLTLPLFVAAGAMMFPTVLGGSLARWRTAWHPVVRALLGAAALAVPVLIVADLWSDHLSAANAAGVVLFVATYLAVAHSLGPVVAARPGHHPVAAPPVPAPAVTPHHWPGGV
jgi:hypothetical protein